MEEKTIYFVVKFEKNPNVLISGYVDINDELAEDVDWYFYDRNGMPSPQRFIEHLGIDGFKGATQEQEFEVDEFDNLYCSEIGVVNDIILQCKETEKYTVERCGMIFEVEGARCP